MCPQPIQRKWGHLKGDHSSVKPVLDEILEFSFVHYFLLFMFREHGIMVNMKVKGKDAQIVHAALERLKAVHPVQLKNLRFEESGRAAVGWDGEVTLKTAQGLVRYFFEVKSHLRPQAVRHLLIQANTFRKKHGQSIGLLLLADYVNPSLCHQLKEADINFVDTAGNVFLRQEPGLHLYVEGKKPQAPGKEAPTRLFQPSGLALLFGLLVTPESVNWSYRSLAKANGVALGTVGWIMRDLREQGYVEPVGKDRLQLIRKKELLDRWVDGYATRLRPKLLVGEFVNPTRDLDATVYTFETYAVEQQMHWALTGGFGAFELLHHYRGATLSIFVEKWTPPTALVALHLLPHKGGDVNVLRSFSPGVFESLDAQPGHPVAHPLLVYAELLFQNGDRELETARQLYTTFLEPSLAKD